MSLKKGYEKKMDAQLKEWSVKIDVLKAKAEKAGADQKVEYYEKVESLQVKKEEVQSKLENLRNSSETAWEQLKEGVEQAWGDLKNAVDDAAEQFK